MVRWTFCLNFEGQPAESDKRGAFSWRRIQSDYARILFFNAHFLQGDILSLKGQGWSSFKVFTLLTYRFIPPDGENVP